MLNGFWYIAVHHTDDDDDDDDDEEEEEEEEEEGGYWLQIWSVQTFFILDENKLHIWKWPWSEIISLFYDRCM